MNLVKYIPYIFIVGSILGVLTTGYFYVTNLQKQRDSAIMESQQYKQAAETNEQTINSLLRDIELINQERNRVYEEFVQSENRVRELSDKLSQHDLGILALQRPNLIENRINRGTIDVFRCFEILSGSAITLEEIDATRKSQTNTSCADIANPNYTGD